jgi:hypothetical protein
MAQLLRVARSPPQTIKKHTTDRVVGTQNPAYQLQSTDFDEVENL